MIAHPQILLRVREVEVLSPTLKRFQLEAADGGFLPTSAAGAHVVVSIPLEDRTRKNAYSITSPPGERGSYAIIVRRVLRSRGGSAQMHEAVKVGDVLNGAPPHNLFPLSLVARKHVLIGGGIGVTPLLSHMQDLIGRGAQFETHQFCNETEVALFERLLGEGGSRVHVHPPGLEAEKIIAILARQPLGTHVYVCGPAPILELVLHTANHLGWPRVAIHHESFGDQSIRTPFQAYLAKSKIEIAVGESNTLLEAVEAAGVEAPYMCRGGACGQCLTRVVNGEPDHRDDFLTAKEKAAGDVMMICVSRAKTPRLVLDL
jgi:ferredoxin-NADP reductase